MAGKDERLAALRARIAPPAAPDKIATARAECHDLARAYPADPEIAVTLAQLNSGQDASPNIIPYISAAVQKYPRHVEARIALVRCLGNANRWRDAVPHARAVLDLQAKEGKLQVGIHNIEAVSTLGTEALFTGDWTTALSYFKTVIGVLKLRFQSAQSPVQPFDPKQLPTLAARPVHKILYLPVEVKAREFEAKSLLAIAAADRGFHVVFGRSWVLNFGKYADLPPGIVLFKTLNAMDAHNMRICAAGAGHVVAALDEEAFGRSNSARALRLNVAPLAVQTCDLVMMQGDAHRRTLEQSYDTRMTEIHTTGNPKSDLLVSNAASRPPPDPAKKKVILFCTMSGNVNPKGRSFARTMEQTLVSGMVNSTKDMIDELGALLEDSAAFEISIIPQLQTAVLAMADRFPDADIVVRPHPIENAELWQSKFTGKKNVRVETDGALTQWLNQCDVMVYISGCGSGTEAALQKVPAIRFEGDGRTKDPDVGLSSRLNIPAKTPADVAKAIADVFENRAANQPDTDLGDFLQLDGGTPASASVAACLNEFFTTRVTDRGPVPIDDLVNLRTRRPEKFMLHPFHLQKFPDTSAVEVNETLRDLAARFGLGEPADAVEIEDGLFLLPPRH